MTDMTPEQIIGQAAMKRFPDRIGDFAVIPFGEQAVKALTDAGKIIVPAAWAKRMLDDMWRRGIPIDEEMSAIYRAMTTDTGS